MPVTQRQANKAIAKELDSTDPGETIRDNVFSAGADEGATVAAGEVAEIATVEVGADGAGSLSDALAVVIGAPASKFKDDVDSKPTVDLQNSTPADVPAGTMWFLGKRSRQSRGGPEITQPKDEDNYSAVSAPDRSDLTPKGKGVRQREVLALYAFNPSTSFSVTLANSTLSFPVIIGTEA